MTLIFDSTPLEIKTALRAEAHAGFSAAYKRLFNETVSDHFDRAEIEAKRQQRHALEEIIANERPPAFNPDLTGDANQTMAQCCKFVDELHDDLNKSQKLQRDTSLLGSQLYLLEARRHINHMSGPQLEGLLQRRDPFNIWGTCGTILENGSTREIYLALEQPDRFLTLRSAAQEPRLNRPMAFVKRAAQYCGATGRKITQAIDSTATDRARRRYHRLVGKNPNSVFGL